MINPESTWRRAAPAGSQAWYDLRRALAVTTERGRDTIFEAINRRDAGTIGNAALVIHELTHLQQDICTGWGFYQAELRFALANARLWLVKKALDRHPGAAAPLMDTLGEAAVVEAAPGLHRRYLDLVELWNEFNGRGGRYLKTSDLAVIESQAHARQMIEHMMAEDAAGARGLLSAPDEYTALLRATLRAFGFAEPLQGGALLLLALLHDRCCDIAFAEPAARVPQPHRPNEMTPADFAVLMPAGLVERFEFALAVAMESFADLAAQPLARGKAGALDILRRLERVQAVDQWLGDLPVATGERLARGWLYAIDSAALLADTRRAIEDDPVRAYRAAAMTAWQPFAPQPQPENSLTRLVRSLPGFRLEQGGEEQWVVDLTPGEGGLPAARRQELFGRCSTDLDGGAMFDAFSSEYLYGHPEPCPLREGCGECSAACEVSIAEGMTPRCRVSGNLTGMVRIPLSALRFSRT